VENNDLCILPTCGNAFALSRYRKLGPRDTPGLAAIGVGKGARVG
jgi:hypothetical protein